MRRFLALGGVAGPLIFTVATVTFGARRPGYDHVAQFISELGVPGTPDAALMNAAGFLPTGLLIAAFGLTLGASMTGPSARAGAALVALFGLGVFVDGIVSCDIGCPQGTGSLANRVHNTVAPIAFIAVTIGIAILGFRFRRSDAWRGLSRYSIASSVIALVTFVGLVSSLDARSTTGLWQRLFLACVFLWCAVVGTRLHRQQSR